MYDICNIKNYILFLKNKCSLSVTLHPLTEEALILTSELISFNIHDNSYCIYVKTFFGAQKHCIERQPKIGEKCKCGSFGGVCYAGVKEYVYPIISREKTVGFICVSGYMTERPEGYIKRTSELFSIPDENLREIYFSSLKRNMPKKEDVDTLIRPLCDMLELAYLKTEENIKDEEDIIDSVVRFIKQYHTENIGLEDICNHFSCSRSHISHLFKKKKGKNIREFICDLRIEDAKSLLKYSNLTVTEIAYSVGFGDSNYFSNVFREKVGVSPMKFRKTSLF
ncbi:MAG: helix-turn-helix transcriptional regulator [Clostridia bacterium]|nr:helix-turn-helix transcriptional regulator [Clostridia bacterium]